MKKDYLEMMRRGESLSFSHLIAMTIQLSIPTILAQISVIVMEYIDASMVGRLGANATAAIGLVASSTWLFGGLCSSASIGFTVLVSQRIGSSDEKGARRIMRTGIAFSMLFSLILAAVGTGIHRILPELLGGEEAIVKDASAYFLIFSLALPLHQFNSLAAGFLQSSGNMRTPGILEALMCLLDVGFNYVFIFRLDMGVTGAAMGTAASQAVTAFLMFYFLLLRSPALHLRKNEPFCFDRTEMKKALKIALPVGFEQIVMSSAYIMSTLIVSPLGSVSIAAHSLAVTAESLCYMPGYGIGVAATTMIGQSIGAERNDLKKKLGYIMVFFGMAVMSVSGALMYLAAPSMMQLLTPVAAISTLGAQMLRIEAFAEPMFAASIVASGVFRGAGDTFVPSCMNLFSMWAVRIPLSAFLSVRIGLKGVWIAMCIELCFRGVIFLIRLFAGNSRNKKENKLSIRSRER